LFQLLPEQALTKFHIGRENRCFIRVPVADGSLTDITFNVNRAVTIDEINEAFYTLHNESILDYTEDPIVSVDIIGNKTHAYLTHN
jgi:glyceraldehyde 3-phosphate dehydrogenase